MVVLVGNMNNNCSIRNEGSWTMWANWDTALSVLQMPIVNTSAFGQLPLLLISWFNHPRFCFCFSSILFAFPESGITHHAEERNCLTRSILIMWCVLFHFVVTFLSFSAPCLFSSREEVWWILHLHFFSNNFLLLQVYFLTIGFFL